MITGFSHVALYTPRLEQTVSFYQEVFHAKLIRAFDRPHKGCWLSLGKDILEVFVENEPLRVLSIRIEKKVNYFYEVTTSD